MVKIPYIKIPSVRVGSIVPTSNIGTGGATPAPPTPITYLTHWKIMGNSEVHGQEIWSCGEYNPTDGKYHILVQPLGGSIADIILDEPLRKYNNAVDSIEYADSVATLTREVEEIDGQLDVLDTPTTELVDAPQIAEAESYSCVISQGAKAVSWSSFNGGILEFYDKITPTDNAYINTGYIPTVNSKFVTHIKRAYLNNCCIYSNATEGKIDGIRFLLAVRTCYVSFGNSRKSNSGLSDLELNIVHAHEQYITINGNSDTYITAVGDKYINEPLTIFSDYYNRSTSGPMAYFNGNSLYSFKIYENDVLVRDFKPCTYNGVAGLWDMVESKFYGNSNNVGTLTASNDA